MELIMGESGYLDIIKEYKGNRLKWVGKFNGVADQALKKDCFHPGFPSWVGLNIKHLDQKPGQETYPDSNSLLTWCNQFAFYMLSALDYDCTMCLATGGTVNTDPLTFYQMAVLAATDPDSKVQEIDVSDGVTLASYGIPCVAISKEGVGHVALFDPMSTPHNPIMVQAGSPSTMGRHTLDDSFIKWGANPRFFHFPQGRGGYWSAWF
jgi:hypothetical protein